MTEPMYTFFPVMGLSMSFDFILTLLEVNCKLFVSFE